VYFTSAGRQSLYLGEGELPDRLSAVQLGGRGLRWAAALVLAKGGRNWLGVKAARTIRLNRPDLPGDAEYYASLYWSFAPGE
jgi:hypothetical protein